MRSEVTKKHRQFLFDFGEPGEPFDGENEGRLITGIGMFRVRLLLQQFSGQFLLPGTNGREQRGFAIRTVLGFQFTRLNSLTRSLIVTLNSEPKFGTYTYSYIYKSDIAHHNAPQKGGGETAEFQEKRCNSGGVRYAMMVYGIKAV